MSNELLAVLALAIAATETGLFAARRKALDAGLAAYWFGFFLFMTAKAVVPS